MPTYEVIYEGTVREVYLVAAESKDEALQNWSDEDPVSSEVIDGAPITAVVVDE